MAGRLTMVQLYIAAGAGMGGAGVSVACRTHRHQHGTVPADLADGMTSVKIAHGLGPLGATPSLYTPF